MTIVRSNSSPAIFDLIKVANNQADQASQATSNLKYKGKAGVAIVHDVKYAFQNIASAFKSAGKSVQELAVNAASYTSTGAKKAGKTAGLAATSVKSGATSIFAKFKDALKSVYSKTIFGRVAALEKENASLRWQVGTLNKNVDPSVSKEVEQRNNFYAVRKDIEKGKAALKPTVTTIKIGDIELGKVIENGNLNRIIKEVSAATKVAASYNADSVVDQAASTANNASSANNNLAVVPYSPKNALLNQTANVITRRNSVNDLSQTASNPTKLTRSLSVGDSPKSDAPVKEIYYDAPDESTFDKDES